MFSCGDAHSEDFDDMPYFYSYSSNITTHSG